jgi:hypothetical protein
MLQYIRSLVPFLFLSVMFALLGSASFLVSPILGFVLLCMSLSLLLAGLIHMQTIYENTYS